MLNPVFGWSNTAFGSQCFSRRRRRKNRRLRILFRGDRVKIDPPLPPRLQDILTMPHEQLPAIHQKRQRYQRLLHVR